MSSETVYLGQSFPAFDLDSTQIAYGDPGYRTIDQGLTVVDLVIDPEEPPIRLGLTIVCLEGKNPIFANGKLVEASVFPYERPLIEDLSERTRGGLRLEFDLSGKLAVSEPTYDFESGLNVDGTSLSPLCFVNFNAPNGDIPILGESPREGETYPFLFRRKKHLDPSQGKETNHGLLIAPTLTEVYAINAKFFLAKTPADDLLAQALGHS